MGQVASRGMAARGVRGGLPDTGLLHKPVPDATESIGRVRQPQLVAHDIVIALVRLTPGELLRGLKCHKRLELGDESPVQRQSPLPRRGLRRLLDWPARRGPVKSQWPPASHQRAPPDRAAVPLGEVGNPEAVRGGGIEPAPPQVARRRPVTRWWCGPACRAARRPGPAPASAAPPCTGPPACPRGSGPARPSGHRRRPGSQREPA